MPKDRNGHDKILDSVQLIPSKTGASPFRRKRLMKTEAKLLHRGLLVEYASLAWMIIESVAAIGAGLFSGSLALIAFGGDSFIELFSSCAVADYLRKVGKEERDESERKEKAEKITTYLLVALIPTIGLGALYSYLSGIKAEASPLGIAIAFCATIIMPILWYEKKRIGEATNCLPLTIDAIESATCFLMSLALLASLLINYLWKIAWIDYIATAAILIFIVKEVLEAFSEMRDSP
jgi:divalent metal cation (Fe/Co/Zn/Cd) transporter